jgi:hypothetical protein
MYVIKYFEEAILLFSKRLVRCINIMVLYVEITESIEWEPSYLIKLFI